jgi:cell division septum initiation protein DivIVA
MVLVEAGQFHPFPWSDDMSIREQELPAFATAFRGYDREQVDEHLEWLRNRAIGAEDRADQAETALAQCRRELASSPTTAGISERLTAMLQLATEEAADSRARPRAEAEAAIAEAASRAERTVDEANQLRDAIQGEIDELSTVREQLLRLLIELGGEIVGATERFRGFAPGSVPRTAAAAPLYDAEADLDAVDEPETISDR